MLFFMDAIGLRPRIAEMAQRIADWGYVVLAPNVFHREGRAEELAPEDDLGKPGAREAFFERAMPRVQALTPDLAEQDIPVYLAALRGLDGVAEDRWPPSATAWVRGSRCAPRLAPRRVAAVGGFHGGGLVTEDAGQPAPWPRGDARAEFVFGHADQDRSMPAEAVAELGARSTQPGWSPATRSTRARSTVTRWPTPRCTTSRPPSGTSPSSGSFWSGRCRWVVGSAAPPRYAGITTANRTPRRTAHDEPALPTMCSSWEAPVALHTVVKPAGPGPR